MEVQDLKNNYTIQDIEQPKEKDNTKSVLNIKVFFWKQKT